MATRSYEHSRVFDQMKTIKEGIQSNLTSAQYLQTLDYLLWNALEPIHAECPTLFNNYIAKIAARQTLKTSIKVTSEDDKSAIHIRLFNMLTASSPAKAHEVAREMRINRGLYFGFISFFCSRLRRYEVLHDPFYSIGQTERVTEMAQIERAMGLRPGGHLYSALKQVQHWDVEARQFKDKIVEKYTRMAIMQAQSVYEEFNRAVKLDDIVQIYLTTVGRAIDRCDSRQGVLTTFIMSWFKSAKSEVAKLARGQHDESYEGLQEEHGDAASDILGSVMPDQSAELYETLAVISKEVDPHGYVRAHLGIPEFLTYQEREVLHLMAIDEDEIEEQYEQAKASAGQRADHRVESVDRRLQHESSSRRADSKPAVVRPSLPLGLQTVM